MKNSVLIKQRRQTNKSLHNKNKIAGSKAMTKLNLAQKNDKVKSPDQLSDYAEEIKRSKEILENAKNALLTCTDEYEKAIHEEDIKEAKSDRKSYDLTRENETVAEYNARKEVEKRKWLDEPVSENVFVKELKEDYPERIELFNRLLNVINTGWYIAKSHTPNEKRMYENKLMKMISRWLLLTTSLKKKDFILIQQG